MTMRDNKRTVHILDRSEALSLLGISKEQDEDFQNKCAKGIKPPKLKVNKIKPTKIDEGYLKRLTDIEEKVNQIMKFLCI
jgi:hypothetical protein